MKKYSDPELEIRTFEAEDVMTESGSLGEDEDPNAGVWG